MSEEQCGWCKKFFEDLEGHVCDEFDDESNGDDIGLPMHDMDGDYLHEEGQEDATMGEFVPLFGTSRIVDMDYAKAEPKIMAKYEEFLAEQEAKKPRVCLAIELYHGREDPDQNLEDWGSQGPVFLDIEYFHMAYLSDPNVGGAIDFLTTKGDLIYYDGIYYGDISVFLFDKDNPEHVQTYGDRIVKYDKRKAKLAEPPQEDPGKKARRLWMPERGGNNETK